ncbi:MAG: hypothetical protein RRY79_06345 [Clostridia bacterium]
MKKRLARAFGILLSTLMLMSCTLVGNAADKPAEAAKTTAVKVTEGKPAETIYVILDDLGATKEIIGVNGGEEYKGIEGELPFNIKLSYAFNNESVIPKDIVGMAGDVKITVDITHNANAKAYFKENMALQMQLPIDTAKSTDIKADGLTGVSVGSTKTFSAIVMPKSDSNFEISYKTSFFEMDAINFVAMPFDTSSMSGFDTSTIGDQIKELEDGIGEYVGGVAKVDDGLGKANGGLKKLSGGGSQLIGGYVELAKGQEELIAALMQMIPPEMQAVMGPKIEGIKQAQDQLNGSLKTYIDGVSSAAGGIAQVTRGLNELAKQGKELDKSVTEAIKPIYDLPFLNNDGEDASPVSFILDEGVSAIQFIMKTDAVTKKTVKDDVSPTNKPEETFFDRLVALFTK